MKMYIVFTYIVSSTHYETEMVGVFDSLELAKIEQEKSISHHIEEFILNEPYTGKSI